jgi:hypothetical protein
LRVNNSRSRDVSGWLHQSARVERLASGVHPRDVFWGHGSLRGQRAIPRQSARGRQRTLFTKPLGTRASAGWEGRSRPRPLVRSRTLRTQNLARTTRSSRNTAGAGLQRSRSTPHDCTPWYRSCGRRRAALLPIACATQFRIAGYPAPKGILNDPNRKHQPRAAGACGSSFVCRLQQRRRQWRGANAWWRGGTANGARFGQFRYSI